MNQTEDGALYLHSNEVGDTVGRVRVLVVHDWPPSSNTPNVRGKPHPPAGVGLGE